MIEIVIPDQNTVKIERLKRKLLEKDATISALKKRIAKMESAMVANILNADKLSVKVEKAVTNALCNVRMIPIFAHGKNAKIVEITTKSVG